MSELKGGSEPKVEHGTTSEHIAKLSVTRESTYVDCSLLDAIIGNSKIPDFGVEWSLAESRGVERTLEESSGVEQSRVKSSRVE